MIEQHKFEAQACVIFQYQVCQLSPDRSINLSDIGVGKDDLPSSLRKVLQHPVIPKERLRPLSMYNGRITSVLDDIACRTDLGWIIPPDKLTMLCQVISDVEKGIEDARDELIKELPTMQQSMMDIVKSYDIDENVRVMLIQRLKKRMPDAAYIKEQVRFWHVFSQLGKVKIGNDELISSLSSGLYGWFNGLFGRVIEEVTRKAKAIRRDLSKKPNRNQVTQKTVQQLREKLVNKIQGLQFVNHKVAPLADSLIHVMLQFPSEGPLTGRNYGDFMTVLNCLCDSNYIVRCLDEGKPLYVRKVVHNVQSEYQTKEQPSYTEIDSTETPDVLDNQDSVTLFSF